MLVCNRPLSVATWYFFHIQISERWKIPTSFPDYVALTSGPLELCSSFCFVRDANEKIAYRLSGLHWFSRRVLSSDWNADFWKQGHDVWIEWTIDSNLRFCLFRWCDGTEWTFGFKVIKTQFSLSVMFDIENVAAHRFGLKDLQIKIEICSALTSSE